MCGWQAEDILTKELKYFMKHIFSTHICYPLQLLLQKIDIQNSNIKSGHHQIGGWHAEDILNKELKYFMEHLFSIHICKPL